MNNSRFKQVFLTILIVALSACALVGIYIFLVGDFGETESKVLITAISLSVFSLLGLCASFQVERAQLLSYGGMLLSLASFILSLNIVWQITESENMAKLFMLLVILAFSAAHVSLLLLLNIQDRIVRMSLYATFGFIAIVATMLCIVVIFNYDDEFYLRLVGVFAILDVLGSIVTPILNSVRK